ncbi:preprotein translocase subunit SecE [Candidatus Kaiserbacteria bacterium]|nr:preprotein translocase subunit SecE [Candidatus Kaiserbacteria bacterium]
MSFIQYIKDTQGELRHVAWPTRLQTIVYTILVALISIGVSLYLGLFDYIFTTGLARFLQVLPATAPTSIEQSIATSTSSGQATSSENTIPLPQFTVQPTTTQQ